MRLKIRVLDNKAEIKDEFVVDAPPDVTAEALIDSLKQMRSNSIDARRDYVASIELPINRPLNSNHLEDGSLVIIKPKGWDIRIVG